MSDSPLTLKDKACIVTGASQGIGRAIARRLCAAGASVLAVARTAARLDETVKACAGLAGTCTAHAADVTSAEQVAAMIARCNERFGRLDVLVNNAGLGHFAPVDELSGEQFREVLETNLFGAFYAIRAAAAPMKARGDGWIFNVASLAAKNAFAGGSAYNASKFGLVGLSEAAMLDLRHHGIRMAAICPGSVETDFAAGRMKDGTSWRLQPEDVAKVITDLLDFPARALPSLIEIRPSQPPKK